MTAQPALSNALSATTPGREPLALAKALTEADAPPKALLNLLHRINQARAARSQPLAG